MSTDKTPIVFYQYFATTDLELFKEKLVKKFRETGHDREIEFKVWVCDDDVPEKGGDIYCYDAFVIRFLAEHGYIHQLPDIIDTSDVFPWVLDTTKIKGKIYGFPWLLCCDSIICRKKDYKEKYTKEDLQGNIVIPIATYAPLYFFIASGLYGEKLPVPEGEDITKRKGYKCLQRLIELTGNRGRALESHYKDEDVLNEFVSGEKKYLAQFSEIVSTFPEDEYAISHLNFTEDDDEVPLYYVDFVSIGAHVKEEKLLDCLDLLEIICSEEFIYDICAPDGKASYMCPALKALYPKLAKLGSFYNNLYELVSNPNNCAMRFSKDYYDILARIVESLDGKL